jgi:hypothetical protein
VVNDNRAKIASAEAQLAIEFKNENTGLKGLENLLADYESLLQI